MSFFKNRRRYRHLKNEVNMTPLIDVMMSLLAIFMITTPLLTTGIPLNLPKGDGQVLEGKEKTLDLNLNAKGEIFIGDLKLSMDTVLPKVKAVVSENPNIQMVISADEKTPYGMVIELMALLRVAGYTSVGLKTDAEAMKIPAQQKKGK